MTMLLHLRLHLDFHQMQWIWTMQWNGKLDILWMGMDGWQLNLQAPFQCNYDNAFN